MGSKNPSTTTQVNKVELSPEQDKLAKLGLGFAEQFASTPLSAPTGGGVAGFNANEIAAQNSAVANATGGMADLANKAGSTNAFLLDPSLLSPDSNPYLKAHGTSIANTMTQNLTENVLPSLRAGDVTTSGMHSGGNTRFMIAEGLASGRNSQAIGDALNSLYSNAYNTGLGAMGQAVGQVPATLQSMLFPSAVQGNVGGQQRAMEQAQLDYASQMDWLNQTLPLIQAQQLYGMIGSMPGGSGVSTVTGAQAPGANPLTGALGGASTGAAIGSVIPGVGTAIGAGLGALLGGGSAFL